MVSCAFDKIRKSSELNAKWVSVSSVGVFLGLGYLGLFIAGIYPIGVVVQTIFSNVPYDFIMFPDLCLGFSMVAGFGVLSPLADKLLGNYCFRFLGIISYSIYLVHGIVITRDFPVTFSKDHPEVVRGLMPSAQGGVCLLILVLAVIFWSMMSYWLIERPFLKLRANLR